jgi:hypothetical protein
MTRHLFMLRDRLMLCHPAMLRPTIMITVRRHGRRASFRMLFLRYDRRVTFSGDVVPGAVDGGGCAIRRSTPDPTAAMVPAITALIELT